MLQKIDNIEAVMEIRIEGFCRSRPRPNGEIQIMKRLTIGNKHMRTTQWSRGVVEIALAWVSTNSPRGILIGDAPCSGWWGCWTPPLSEGNGGGNVSPEEPCASVFCVCDAEGDWFPLIGVPSLERSRTNNIRRLAKGWGTSAHRFSPQVWTKPWLALHTSRGGDQTHTLPS